MIVVINYILQSISNSDQTSKQTSKQAIKQTSNQEMSGYVFHENQITAGRELLESDARWSILLALTQSGKSGTYLWMACEAIRLGKFSKVAIVTGISDTSLRDQTSDNIKRAIRAYVRVTSVSGFITMSIGDLHIMDALDVFEEAIHSYFSQDLKHIEDLRNTLVIHEEAHYAQDIKNRPWKEVFAGKMGLEGMVPSAGNMQRLCERNMAIVSVSATPISEIHRKFDMEKSTMPQGASHKHIVQLHPGCHYTGIANLQRCPVDIKDIGTEKHLHHVLSREKYRGKIVVVRTKTKEQGREQILSALREIGADESCYHSIFGTEANKGMGAYAILDKKPSNADVPFVVQVCGKGRLGQELAKESEKKHIGAVYEYSKRPNLDTLIQGLPGRMCGYHTNRDIDIYYSDAREDGVQAYIEFWASGKANWEVFSKYLSPASHVTKGKSCSNTCGDLVCDADGIWWRKTVPIELPGKISGPYCVDDARNKLEDIYDTLDNPDKEKIWEDVNNYTNPNRNTFPIHHNGRDLQNISYQEQETEQKLAEGVLNCTRTTAQFTNQITDHNTGDVCPYILCKSEDRSFIIGFIQHGPCCNCSCGTHKERPTVHKSSIYNVHVPEEEKASDSNGAQLILLTGDTIDQPDEFAKQLKAMVRRTYKKNPEYVKGTTKCLSSLDNSGSRGIFLRKIKYSDGRLEDIIRSIEIEEGVVLTVAEYKQSTKSKSKQYSAENYLRIKTIKWKKQKKLKIISHIESLFA